MRPTDTIVDDLEDKPHDRLELLIEDHVDTSRHDYVAYPDELIRQSVVGGRQVGS